MKAFYVMAALLFVALAAAAAGYSARASAQTSAPAKAATVVIHMHDFSFDPNGVTVAPGTTVEWDNDDSARHTVTASDKSFDSGDLKPGSKWSHTFTAAGTYEYTCTQHPEMTGTIKVSS